MYRKRFFVAGLSLLSLAGIAACGDEPSGSPAAVASPVGGQAVPDASAKPTATPLPPLAEGIPDVSGCWRAIGSDGFASGNQSDILRVDADAFVFAGPPARTKLVFKPDRSFSEVNYDEAHPFFPKGYVHSVGSVSADGQTLSRSLEGQPAPQTLQRCETAPQRPLTPIIEGTPRPSGTPPIDSGHPDQTPIVLPASGSPQPQPTASVNPLLQHAIQPTATPVPVTPTPTAPPAVGPTETPSTEP